MANSLELCDSEFMKLSQLVDLAFGTSNLGIINFKMLKDILLIILKKLHIENKNLRKFDENFQILDTSSESSRSKNLNSDINDNSSIASTIVDDLTFDNSPQKDYHNIDTDSRLIASFEDSQIDKNMISNVLSQSQEPSVVSSQKSELNAQIETSMETRIEHINCMFENAGELEISDREILSKFIEIWKSSQHEIFNSLKSQDMQLQTIKDELNLNKEAMMSNKKCLNSCSQNDGDSGMIKVSSETLEDKNFKEYEEILNEKQAYDIEPNNRSGENNNINEALLSKSLSATSDKISDVEDRRNIEKIYKLSESSDLFTNPSSKVVTETVESHQIPKIFSGVDETYNSSERFEDSGICKTYSSSSSTNLTRAASKDVFEEINNQGSSVMSSDEIGQYSDELISGSEFSDLLILDHSSQNDSIKKRKSKRKSMKKSEQYPSQDIFALENNQDVKHTISSEKNKNDTSEDNIVQSKQKETRKVKRKNKKLDDSCSPNYKYDISKYTEENKVISDQFVSLSSNIKEIDTCFNLHDERIKSIEQDLLNLQKNSTSCSQQVISLFEKFDGKDIEELIDSNVNNHMVDGISKRVTEISQSISDLKVSFYNLTNTVKNLESFCLEMESVFGMSLNECSLEKIVTTINELIKNQKTIRSTIETLCQVLIEIDVTKVSKIFMELQLAMKSDVKSIEEKIEIDHQELELYEGKLSKLKLEIDDHKNSEEKKNCDVYESLSKKVGEDEFKASQMKIQKNLKKMIAELNSSSSSDDLFASSVTKLHLHHNKKCLCCNRPAYTQNYDIPMKSVAINKNHMIRNLKTLENSLKKVMVLNSTKSNQCQSSQRSCGGMHTVTGHNISNKSPKKCSNEKGEEKKNESFDFQLEMK